MLLLWNNATKNKKANKTRGKSSEAKGVKRVHEDGIGSSSAVISTEHGEESGTIKVRTLHGEPEGLANLFTQPKNAFHTEDEEIDLTFDLDSGIKSESVHIGENFSEEWVCQLKWKDRASLG